MQVLNIANPLQINSIAHSHILAQAVSHGHRLFWKKEALFCIPSEAVPKYVVTKTKKKKPKFHLFAPWCSVHRVSARFAFQCKSTRGRQRVLWSGSLQGLSVLMLVSFYLCHCSLLCFSDFLVILSAIYQRKEKEQKKMCCFFALWPLSTFFEGKCFVRFLILCRKK